MKVLLQQWPWLSSNHPKDFQKIVWRVCFYKRSGDSPVALFFTWVATPSLLLAGSGGAAGAVSGALERVTLTFTAH